MPPHPEPRQASQSGQLAAGGCISPSNARFGIIQKMQQSLVDEQWINKKKGYIVVQAQPQLPVDVSKPKTLYRRIYNIGRVTPLEFRSYARLLTLLASRRFWMSSLCRSSYGLVPSQRGGYWLAIDGTLGRNDAEQRIAVSGDCKSCGTRSDHRLPQWIGFRT